MLSGLSNILPGGFSGFFGSSYIFINVISSKRYDGTYAKILCHLIKKSSFSITPMTVCKWSWPSFSKIIWILGTKIIDKHAFLDTKIIIFCYKLTKTTLLRSLKSQDAMNHVFYYYRIRLSHWCFWAFYYYFLQAKYKKANNVLKKNGLIYCMQLFDLYHLQITLFPNKTWPNTKT